MILIIFSLIILSFVADAEQFHLIQVFVE